MGERTGQHSKLGFRGHKVQ